MNLQALRNLTRWLHRVLPGRRRWRVPVVYRPWSDLLCGIQLGVLRSERDNVLVTPDTVTEWVVADVKKRLGGQLDVAFARALREMGSAIHEYLSTEGRTVCRVEAGGIRVTVVSRHSRSEAVD